MYACGFFEAVGAKVIDLRNQFVLPGLIDSHVHLDSDKAGQEGLLEGLTRAFGSPRQGGVGYS